MSVAAYTFGDSPRCVMFVPKEGRSPAPPVGRAQPGELQVLSNREPSFTLGERAALSVVLSHEAVGVLRGTSVESTTSFMLRMGLSTLPVLDHGGELVGVVSIHDLLARASGRLVALDGSDAATVGDVMTASTLALGSDTPISQAVLRLLEHDLSEVPVRCEPCGGYCIVSALELLRWLSQSRLGAR